MQVADLAGQAVDWARRWGCRVEGQVITTPSAVLLPVRRGAGLPLMVKTVDPEGDEMGAAALLVALGGHRAVRVHDHAGNALLMERILPGGPTLEQWALGGAQPARTGAAGPADAGAGARAVGFGAQGRRLGRGDVGGQVGLNRAARCGAGLAGD